MRIWPILGPEIWGIMALICVQKLDLTPKNRDLATFFFPGFLEILDLFKGRKTIKMGKNGGVLGLFCLLLFHFCQISDIPGPKFKGLGPYFSEKMLTWP